MWALDAEKLARVNAALDGKTKKEKPQGNGGDATGGENETTSGVVKDEPAAVLLSDVCARCRLRLAGIKDSREHDRVARERQKKLQEVRTHDNNEDRLWTNWFRQEIGHHIYTITLLRFTENVHS